MTPAQPVRPGTAEQLARLSHFAQLDLPEVDELDAVARWILGDVGDRTALWEQLQEDCEQLWHLITDDWDLRDLDDLTDDDYRKHGGVLFVNARHTLDVRHDNTVNRLVGDIERRIRLARYTAAEERRADARRQHRAETEARVHGGDA